MRCQAEELSEKGKLIVPVVLNSGPRRDSQETSADVGGLLPLPTGVSDEQVPGALIYPVLTPSSQLPSQAGNSEHGG